MDSRVRGRESERERERGRLFTLVRFWCTASLSPSSNWAVAVLIYLPFIKPPWSVRDAPMQSGPLRAREVAATTKKNRLSMPSTPFPHNRYVYTYVCDTHTHTEGQYPSWTRIYTIRRWHVGDKKEKGWIKKRERRGEGRGRKIGSIGWESCTRLLFLRHNDDPRFVNFGNKHVRFEITLDWYLGG